MTASPSGTAIGRSILSLARFSFESTPCWSLQQVAQYAKASGGTGGGGHANRTNRLLKVMEPQQTTAVTRSLEELEDAKQRCEGPEEGMGVYYLFGLCGGFPARPKQLRLCRTCLIPDHLHPLPRSREYSRLRMRQHRIWQADLSTKLKLKQAALAALPEQLRAAAKVPDLSLFPLNRNVWRETPPVEAKVVKAAAHTSRTRNIGTKRQG